MKHTIKIRGINLVYEDHGKGDVLVFIHGQPFNRSMWQYQIGRFAQTYRLIVPDLRGYGETDVPDSSRVLLDELALDILHLLKKLKIERATFVGLSMGGQIVLELFQLAAGKFNAMVLADTDARAEDASGYQNRLDLSNRMVSEGMLKFTSDRISQFISSRTFETKPDVVAHLQQMMTGTNPIGAAMVQRGRAEREDHTNLLGEVDCPALIIVGADDVFTPVSAARYMHERITGSQLSIIENAGHIPSMEQPDTFNDVLERFLARVYGH